VKRRMSLRFMVCLLAILTITSMNGVPQAVGAETWHELGPAPIGAGPWTGRFTAMAASPTDRNVWFGAAASGGVWGTSNVGIDWAPLTDGLPTLSIGALAMDPNDETVIYAGTGEANYANHCLYGLGLYKSTDSGDTWTVLAADVFSGRTFSRLEVSHGDSQVIFAAIAHAGGFYPTRNAAKNHPGQDGPVGIFKSTDGGVTWTHLLNGLPNAPGSDLVIDPVDADVVYAAIGNVFGQPENGIYKTTDGGDSWTKLAGGLPSSGIGRISLAIAPTDRNRLYAIFVNDNDEFGNGASTRDVYRTDDGGGFWIATDSGNFQATYGWFLSTATVHPEYPDICVVGGLNMLVTTNAGGTWSNRTPPHVDLHGFAWDALDRLLVATDGGVYLTTDLGHTWFARNNDIGAAQFYPGISLHPNRPEFLLGGLQDNGTVIRVTDANDDWTHPLGGDGGHTALHPDNPNVMFGEYQGTGNLFRSTNGGSSFSLMNSGINSGDRNCFLPPVVYHPTLLTRLLYGTHRVYQSTNNGSSWQAISGDLTGGNPAAIRCLAIAPSNANTVYAATNDGRVQVSQDGGFVFNLKAENIPGWPRTTREFGIDPGNDAVVFHVVSNFGVDQIRRSTDYGDTWTTVDGNLPDVPANTAAVMRVNDSLTVFVGVDNGVYMSHTAMTDNPRWRRLGDEFPNVVVNDLIVDRRFDRLVAGTLGRGAWQIDLPFFGDADTDKRVDIADFAAFQACFSGSSETPGFTEPSAACQQVFDHEFDTDVDEADYVAFFERFVGP
jgi:photosystem II stability/assembly factor-like uncharacterized protein